MAEDRIITADGAWIYYDPDSPGWQEVSLRFYDAIVSDSVRAYVHADGSIIIPQDCQSDPNGAEGRWMDAATFADAIVWPTDGIPRVLTFGDS